jgi:hypothetical protein
MTMVSLILKPWINYMIELGVEPRVLADDLMVTATGESNQTKTIRAMHASRQYFHDIAAKVANNKCFTFATDPKVRKNLAEFVWDKRGTKIPNFKSFRDLGAHMYLTANANGATLSLLDSTKPLRWRKDSSGCPYPERPSTRLLCAISCQLLCMELK